jgi:hypothetical protein
MRIGNWSHRFRSFSLLWRHELRVHADRPRDCAALSHSMTYFSEPLANRE